MPTPVSLGEELKSFKGESLEGLIDEVRLSAWLDEQGLSPADPLEVSRISGGISNESIGLHRGGQRWVLRRPAKVALAGADKGMEREFRLLSALEGTGVPIPKLRGFCGDASVIGAAFYLMDFVEGHSSLVALPEAFEQDARLRREAALSCMEALGRLAAVDWQARGLAGYGRPEGFHARQVARWLKQLAATQGPGLPGIREVGAWLEAERPADGAWTPRIMHGDYHSANILLANDAPGRVAAILDWENSTIGDPLLDLGGFLRMWMASDRAGWCEEEAMLDCWSKHSGLGKIEVGGLRYYKALSAFKLAVMLEGIHQRSAADPSRGSNGALGDIASKLAAEAREIIDA